MNIEDLSDEELVSQLDACCADNRRSLVRIIGFLIGVEERRIHLKSACSSMFDYCTRLRGMSEGQAYRRIASARLVRRFPFLLEQIERGEVCISTLALLSPHVTTENVHELVASTMGKKRLHVQMLLAERFGTTEPRIRYGAPFMPDQELMDLMQRARDLLSHVVPNGDLLTLTKRAYVALIEKAEKEQRAKVKTPRAPKGSSTKNVPRANVRAVFERDHEQCAFVDPVTGARCPGRAFLQVDHVHARGKGGGHDLPNLRSACAAHNRWFAEQAFGRDHIEKQIRLRRRRSRALQTTPSEPPK